MDLFTLFILCWLACAPVGYIVIRTLYKADFSTWTRADRLWWLIASILNGPFGIVIGGVIYLADRIVKSDWGKGDARW